MTDTTAEPLHIRIHLASRISYVILAILSVAAIIGGSIWVVYALTTAQTPRPDYFLGLLPIVFGGFMLRMLSRWEYGFDINATTLTVFRPFKRTDVIKLSDIDSVCVAQGALSGAKGSTPSYYLSMTDSHGGKVRLYLDQYSHALRREIYPRLSPVIEHVDFEVDAEFLRAWEAWFYFIDGRNDQFARKLQLTDE